MVGTGHLKEPGAPTEWVIFEEVAIRVEANGAICSGAPTAGQAAALVGEHSIRVISICDDDSLESVGLKR